MFMNTSNVCLRAYIIKKKESDLYIVKENRKEKRKTKKRHCLFILGRPNIDAHVGGSPLAPGIERSSGCVSSDIAGLARPAL
jgi:hypothetical protein